MSTAKRIVDLTLAALQQGPLEVDKPELLIHDVQAAACGLTVILADGRVVPLRMAQRAAESMRHAYLADLAAAEDAARQQLARP